MKNTKKKKEEGEINGSTNFLQREQAQGYRNSISPGAAVGAIRIRKRRLHRNDRGEVRLRRNQRKADARKRRIRARQGAHLERRSERARKRDVSRTTSRTR